MGKGFLTEGLRRGHPARRYGKKPILHGLDETSLLDKAFPACQARCPSFGNTQTGPTGLTVETCLE